MCKKWFIVPSDENPASTSLPLGQLVGDIETISHPLNRATRPDPEPNDVHSTTTMDYVLELSRDRHLGGDVGITADVPPARVTVGGANNVGRSHNQSTQAEVVLTEVLRPSDTYTAQCFEASRAEPEMKNHLRQALWWRRKVYMVTARKVGWATTVHRGEATSLDQTIKAIATVADAVQPGIQLTAGWRNELRIQGFTPKPCVFAVQLRRVMYDKDPKTVTTKAHVKNALFERKDEEGNDEETQKGEDETLDEDAWIPAGTTDEEPRVEDYEYDRVLLRDENGLEEEFLVPVEEN